MSSELKSKPARARNTVVESSTAADEFSVVLPVPVGQRSDTRWAQWAMWLLQIAAAVGAGYWIAATRETTDSRIELPPPAESKSDAFSITVTTAPVVSRQVERSIEAVGNLHGYDELTLKSKISGRVLKLHHEFGDKVAQGELLIEIDPTDALLAVEQSKRSLNSELAKWGFLEVPDAKTDLTKLPTVVSSKLRSDWARSQYARLQALKDRGSVIAEELEQAKTNAMVAESDYANQLLLARAGAATSQLKKSELDIALQQLKETKVFVPVRDTTANQTLAAAARYTITDRYVSEGAWLAVGSDLFRMVIDETLKLRLSIPEKFASQLRINQRVEVSSLSSPQTATGTVARIGPSVDPNTRTFQIEVEVPNQDGALKTGGFSSARVIVEEAATATTVPVAALVTFAGIHKVFVVTGDTVQEYKVKLGQETLEWVEIVEPPLPSDARVVVSGNSQLADGAAIRVREPMNDSPSSQEDGGN